MVAWKIGPTFAAELQAAGVPSDGYSWNIMTGAFMYHPDVPEALVDQVDAVYAVHDPAAQTEPPTPWPPNSPEALRAVGVVVPPPPPPPPPPEPQATRWQIDQQVVIERLEAAHRFGAFMDLLDDSNQLTRELWRARYRVWNDDPLVIGLIRDAGADPGTILDRP